MTDINSIVITGIADVDWEQYESMFWVQNKLYDKKMQMITVVVKGNYLTEVCRNKIVKGIKVRVVGSWDEDHIIADHVEVVE